MKKEGSADGHKGASTKPAAASLDRRDEVLSFYRAQGGPLLAWLKEEASRRGDSLSKLAHALGVEVSYLLALQAGRRHTAHIGQEFADSCAQYLGVPAIVVKLLAGRICPGDFVTPGSTQQVWRRRALTQLSQDPVFGPLLPADLSAQSGQLQDAVIALYGEATGIDVHQHRRLPVILQHLQRAVLVTDDASGLAAESWPAAA